MQYKLRQKGFATIIVILLVLVVVTVVGFLIYRLSLNRIGQMPILNGNPLANKNTETGGTVTLTGSIQEIHRDLGLIEVSSDQLNGYYMPDSHYYQAGTYTNGQYTGYVRVIAIANCNCPGPPTEHIFATKDYKTYILDGDPASAMLPDTDAYSIYQGLNKSKITQVTHLPQTHPDNILLTDKFGLQKSDVVTESDYNDINNLRPGINPSASIPLSLITDYSKYQQLKSSSPGLTFYSSPSEQFPSQDPSVVQSIQGTNRIMVVDSTGLGYWYTFAQQDAITKYLADFAAYKQDTLAYDKQVNAYYASYNAATESGRPTPPPLTAQQPLYPESATIIIKSSDVTTSQNLYNSYQGFNLNQCGGYEEAYVAKGITTSDLQAIGTWQGILLYKLNNNNHPLLKAAYALKQNLFSYPPYLDASPDPTLIKSPTYEQYIARNPLLLFQDPFGRWLVFNEYEYPKSGGCGKPVVYLYPEKPTQVKVQFALPMRLDTQIPTYHNGWDVLAQPNGTLTNLQPQFTDCNVIDTTRAGSEYAKSACTNNQYPYLYWAGQSLTKSYPTIDKGWIVDKANIGSFMNQKLDEIGLTANEKSDMLSYWLPAMLDANAPYYRISFLQTQEMNSLVPMTISPMPKSINRIFLDYLPLSEKPTQQILPQQLNHFVRDGFTLIEWGGLHR